MGFSCENFYFNGKLQTAAKAAADFPDFLNAGGILQKQL